MSYLIIQAFQKYSWVLLVLILVLGWFSPVLIIITFICMTAPIIFSFKYGRCECQRISLPLDHEFVYQ